MEQITINTNKEEIVTNLLTLAQETYELGKVNIEKLSVMDASKLQMDVVESRHIEVISQDKVKYPNEKAREAALTIKCDADPLYQQYLTEYNKAKNEIAENKNQMNYNRDRFDVWLGYLNDK